MTCVLVSVMLFVRILFIDTSLHKPVVWFTKFSFRLGTSEVYAWGELIRPICITILYHNLLYSLIYFIFRDVNYVILSIFACLMNIGEITAGVRILLEKGPSRYHISEEQQFPENTQKLLFCQMTEEARRGA